MGGGSGWGTHVHPGLIHVNRWQKSPQCCKVVLCLYRRFSERPILVFKGFPGGAEVKASACNVGDLGSIPGLGRSPGEGNGNPLQYSCLENPMDGGAWWATVHGSQRVGHN